MSSRVLKCTMPPPLWSCPPKEMQTRTTRVAKSAMVRRSFGFKIRDPVSKQTSHGVSRTGPHGQTIENEATTMHTAFKNQEQTFETAPPALIKII